MLRRLQRLAFVVVAGLVLGLDDAHANGGANTGGATATAAVLGGHAMVSLDGEPVSLGDYAGEVLVVNFWASWCAPCRRELPLLDGWDRRWRGQGARVVAVAIDRDRSKSAEFVAAARLDLTVLHDGPDGLARQLDLPAVPTSYVLDRTGKVVLTIHGGSEADLARLERTVDALLAADDRRSGS